MSWCRESLPPLVYKRPAPLRGRGLKPTLGIGFLTGCRRPVSIALLLLTIGFTGDSAWIYAKAILAQQLIKNAWSQTLDGAQQVKPWPWADTWPVARLQSVEQDTDLYVLNGAQGSALAFGPGYMPASAQPGGYGTSIIAGHRDTHFQFMRQLEQGDQLQLTNTEGLITHYTITALEVIDSSKQSLIVDQGLIDQAQIILVTCYPFDAIETGGPLRYVATAVAAANRYSF